jgi:uncharacterized HhH-GPD family protein
MPATTPTLAVTGDPDADALLVEEPLALMIGMLLDQQVPMEWAFKGPATLKVRLGGRLDATAIAAMSEEDFVAVCSAKPAVHRFPGSMGKRVHQLCTVLVEEYDGDAAAVWTDAKSGAALYTRVRALPGFGDEKAKIFVAMLAKRFGVAPRGWKQVTAPFSDRTPRSVADIDSPESLARVRAWKKAQKAAGRSKQD